MTYKETIDYMYATLPMFHREGKSAYKANLDNIKLLSEKLGEKHKQFKSIHIAGTNGKGSTSHMLAAVLQKAGYRTGLFTSPHLLDFRERIRVDGQMVSEEFVVQFISEYNKLIEEIEPSFFEITTIMAFEYFAQQKVEVAVIETGLGGRLDATNIITPILSVITNISLDHCDILGNTIEAIAGEKAGIIKPEVPVIVGETHPQTQDIFIEKAKHYKAEIIFADQVSEAMLQQTDCVAVKVYLIKSDLQLIDNKIFTIDLLGDYQKKNINTVLVAINKLMEEGLEISMQEVSEGLLTASTITGLQGRWQVLSQKPLIIADTGHNEGGFTYTMKQIKAQEYNKLHIVLGFVKEKDIDKVLKQFPAEAQYYFTQANIPRALAVNELSEVAILKGLKGEKYNTVKEALEAAKKNADTEDFIFIGGSTFVVAEAMLV